MAKQPANPVEPIKVIRGNPEEGNEEAERVAVINSADLQSEDKPVQPLSEHPGFKAPKKPERLKYCWNCSAQGDQNELKDGVCPSCGFELDKMHNVFLETDRRTYASSLAAAQGNY